MGSASVSPYPLTARPPSPLLVPSPLSIGKDSKWQGDQGLGPYPLFFSILIHFQSLAVNTIYVLLLLLLSRFSCVRLCAAPQTAAHQASLGCHFLLQCMKVKSESEVAQSCPTLSDPMDCSLPVSSVHGIFQARVLEWGAIAFSDLCADNSQI